MPFWNRRNKLLNPPTHSQTVEFSEYSLWQLVSEIRNLAAAINFVYAEYDLMAEDTIIGAALQMYADNAVQADNYTGKVLEIVSDSPQLKKDLNAVLHKLSIEDRLWNTAYNTAKYGNKYWKVILTPDNKDIDSLEEIDDPSCVMDLYLRGEPVAYAFNENDKELSKSQEYQLFDHRAFIHFMIQSGKISDRIELQDYRLKDEVTGEPKLVKYQIKRGESMLEGVRAIYRILKALEDNLIASIIAKGEYTKIFNIEVGDANEMEAKKMVNKVKRLFDSRMSMDTREGQQSSATYNQPRAFMDPIFNSINNGRGAISIATTGGEVEVKDITHIDYFNKLKFSGLHITPSMLAFEENIPGGLGSSANSMVQQDIRFAMYEKKLIVAMINGVTDLLNLWLTIKGRNHEIGKFQVRMAVPSSAEDLAELDELKARLESIDSLSEIITKNAPGINTAAVMEILLDEYIPNKQLLNKISKLMKESVDIADQESEVAKAEIKSTLRQLKDDEVPPDQMQINMDTEKGVDKKDGKNRTSGNINGVAKERTSDRDQTFPRINSKSLDFDGDF